MSKVLLRHLPLLSLLAASGCIPHEPVNRPTFRFPLAPAGLAAELRAPSDTVVTATQLTRDDGTAVPAADVVSALGGWRMIVAPAEQVAAIVAPAEHVVASSETAPAVCFIAVTPFADVEAAIWACKSIRASRAGT